MHSGASTDEVHPETRLERVDPMLMAHWRDSALTLSTRVASVEPSVPRQGLLKPLFPNMEIKAGFTGVCFSRHAEETWILGRKTESKLNPSDCMGSSDCPTWACVLICLESD